MNKNIDELVSAMSNLKDNGRIPTLNKHRRKNYKEATWRRKGNTIDWYFEYKIEIDNDNNVCLHIYEALHKSQMHSSMEKMMLLAEKSDIQSIALPKIGAGLGGLKWEEVREIIDKVAATHPTIDLYVVENFSPTR